MARSATLRRWLPSLAGTVRSSTALTLPAASVARSSIPTSSRPTRIVPVTGRHSVSPANRYSTAATPEPASAAVALTVRATASVTIVSAGATWSMRNSASGTLDTLPAASVARASTTVGPVGRHDDRPGVGHPSAAVDPHLDDGRRVAVVASRPPTR